MGVTKRGLGQTVESFKEKNPHKKGRPIRGALAFRKEG